MDIECKMQSNAGVGSRAQVSLSLYPAPVWQSFLTATGGTQIFFFFFFNTLAPDNAWKCPYSRAATGSASLGRRGFRLPQEEGRSECLISSAWAHAVTHSLLYKEGILPSAPLFLLVVF